MSQASTQRFFCTPVFGSLRFRVRIESLRRIAGGFAAGWWPGIGVLWSRFDPDDPQSPAVRRATLENDRKVLEQQGSTFFRHGQSQADEINQGRFAATGAPRVIGSTPSPAAQYPAAAPHQFDPSGPEPSLGYEINRMPELESSVSSPSAEADGPTSGDPPTSAPDPSARSVSERGVGSSPFSNASPARIPAKDTRAATSSDRAGLVPSRTSCRSK